MWELGKLSESESGSPIRNTWSTCSSGPLYFYYYFPVSAPDFAVFGPCSLYFARARYQSSQKNLHLICSLMWDIRGISGAVVYASEAGFLHRLETRRQAWIVNDVNRALWGFREIPCLTCELDWDTTNLLWLCWVINIGCVFRKRSISGTILVEQMDSGPVWPSV